MKDHILEKLMPDDILEWEDGVRYLEIALQYSDYRGLQIIFDKMHRLILSLDFRTPEDKARILRIYRVLESFFDKMSLEYLNRVLSDTYLGNIMWIITFAKRIQNIYSPNLPLVLLVYNLQYLEDILLNDHLVGYLLKDDEKIYVSLDKDSLKHYNTEILVKIYDGIFYLFLLETLDKNEELIKSFIHLYEMGVYKKHLRWAKLFYSSTSLTKEDLIKMYYSLTNKKVNSLEDIDFGEFYYILRANKFPAYFENSKIRYNGVVYNDNFFPLLYKDKTGKTKILKPFNQININDVQKIYEFHSNTWITPRERYGKIQVEDIYSFKKIMGVPDQEAEIYINKIKNMSEDDIEKRLRKITGDYGSTSHTPIEKADYITFKLKINNENDLRNAGIIIKGKSFKKQVTSKDVTHQIVKAVKEEDISLIVMITLHPLADDARSDLVDLCNKFNKMYTIMTPLDLAKLFLAYNVMDL